jgi:heme oxygenase
MTGRLIRWSHPITSADAFNESVPAMRHQPFAEDIRVFLSAATRGLHDEVDRRAGRFDLASASGRAGLLRFVYRGLQPVEDGLDSAGAARLYPAWPDRRRAAMLRRDLRRIGAELPDDRPPVDFACAEAAWGALYVLEGSRLGARMIARDWPVDERPGYLDPDPAGTWQTFLGILRRYDPGRSSHPLILDGASRAFTAFLG